MDLATRWANQSMLYEKVAEFSLERDQISNAISMVAFALAYRTAAHQLFGALVAMWSECDRKRLFGPRWRTTGTP